MAVQIIAKTWMGLLNILWPYYMVTVMDDDAGYQRFRYLRSNASNGSNDATILANIVID